MQRGLPCKLGPALLDHQAMSSHCCFFPGMRYPSLTQPTPRPLTRPSTPAHPTHPTVNNVRVLNGATMGNGAAVQISGAVKSVRFDWCDFMGNIATDGGAGGWGVQCNSVVWEGGVMWE